MTAVSPELGRTAGVLRRQIDGGLHPGAQLCVWPADADPIDLVVGEARPGAAMSPGTILPWLSSAKPITAAAVLQQVEVGRLGLDDPVVEHLPEFAAHGKEAITIRHLLTHTGGFRAAAFGFPQQPWDAIIETICRTRPEPRWTPGEKAGYHITTSWFVLGELVQRASGEPLPAYVRRHIFEPLGMGDCYIGMPAQRYAAEADRIGEVLDTSRDPRHARPWHTEPFLTACSPGSSACGTARQHARLYRALLGGGALDGAHILGPDTVATLTARQRAGMFDHTFKAVVDWGLGVIRDSKRYGYAELPYGFGPHASDQTFGHGGNQSSVAMADPEHGLVVVAVFNGTPGESAHQHRVHGVLAAVYEDLGLG